MRLLLDSVVVALHERITRHPCAIGSTVLAVLYAGSAIIVFYDLLIKRACGCVKASNRVGANATRNIALVFNRQLQCSKIC